MTKNEILDKAEDIADQVYINIINLSTCINYIIDQHSRFINIR